MGEEILPYSAFLHSHVSSWALTLIFFLISYLLLRSGKEKGQKITHMILRLFFILTIITGAGLVIKLNFMLIAIIKMIVALWLIASMELILTKGKKGQPTGGLWIQFLVSIIIVFIIGYGFI